MERLAIELTGIVQGVGFRPFVYNLAVRNKLVGFVRDHEGGVSIEVEGPSSDVRRFLSELIGQPPPQAHIESLHWLRKDMRGESEFHIEESVSAPGGVISPDAAT
jgi:hydrogenase maturation protein HypF